MKKHIFALCIAVLITKMTFALNLCDTNQENCFSCGDECTVEFIPSTKTLHISSNGVMNSYATDGQAKNVPWYEVRESVKNITFEGSINKFDTYTFFETNIQIVTIPDSVTVIGFGAFYKAYELKEVNIPDLVQKIGSYAFADTSLKSIAIPDSVQSIGRGAFANTPLESIVISDQTKFIDKEVLLNTSENLKIYCTGNLKTCQKNVGDYANKVIKATTKKINGVSYVYDSNDNLCTKFGHRINKRIYTIDEANAVAGKVNSVKIRYR